MEPPVCECHGEPKLWIKDARRKAGGFWNCQIKNRESKRRWYVANAERERERNRERQRLWRAANPEKKRECNARRLKIGDMYLGMVGFTNREREAILNGSPK